MLLKQVITTSIILLLVLITPKTGVAKKNALQNTEGHHEKIYQLLSSSPSRENFVKASVLYSEILAKEEDPFIRISYAVLLQTIAKSKTDLEKARQMEEEMHNKLFLSSDHPYSIMSSYAAMLASMYNANIFMPKDAEKARHWRGVSQSFEETSLYRCNDRNTPRCWRSKSSREERRKMAKENIQKLIIQSIEDQKLN